MTSDVLIRAEGLSKCYQIYDQPRDRLFQFISRGRRQYFREFWALRDASFAIGRGESVGIIGRNGSGKSTLLQLIAGTLTPTGGSLEIQGRISALLELGSGFNPDFTGRENVHINAAILGLDAMDIQQRFAEIEAFADIGDFMDQPVKTYSSGMLMRLAFAVTVCSDPQILIVDEALAVGDAAFQFKCLDRLGKLIETGTTLLFVSHDLALVKTYCKNAVYLRQGELVFFGPVEQAAEVYLQDLRAAQRKDLATDHSGLVVKKPPLSEGGLAFGTGLGRIVRVTFQGHEGRHELVEYGTRLVIEAEIEYGPDVRSPRLAIAIADRRNVVVAGKFSQILPAARDGWKKARLSFDFLAALGEGHYSVSVVLEDKPGTMQGLLVEKQANALVFDMLPPPDDQAFLGALDLGIKIESQELE